MRRDSFLRRSFRLRVAVVGAVLAGCAAWAGWIRHGESRDVDWSRPHVVVICPVVAERADDAAVAPLLEQAPAVLATWMAAQQEW